MRSTTKMLTESILFAFKMSRNFWASVRLEIFPPFPKRPKPKTIDGGVMIVSSLKKVSFLELEMETIGEIDVTSSSKKL